MNNDERFEEFTKKICQLSYLLGFAVVELTEAAVCTTNETKSDKYLALIERINNVIYDYV